RFEARHGLKATTIDPEARIERCVLSRAFPLNPDRHRFAVTNDADRLIPAVKYRDARDSNGFASEHILTRFRRLSQLAAHGICLFEITLLRAITDSLDVSLRYGLSLADHQQTPILHPHCLVAQFSDQGFRV